MSRETVKLEIKNKFIIKVIIINTITLKATSWTKSGINLSLK